MQACRCLLLLCLLQGVLGEDHLHILSKSSKPAELAKAPWSAKNPAHILPEIREYDSCVPGKTYRVECNTCRCTPTGTLMCTKMACYNNWKQIFKKNRNKKEKINLRLKPEKPNKRKLQYLPQVTKATPCKPGKLYRFMCKRCFCDDQNVIMCSKKEKEGCTFDKQGNPPLIRSPEDIAPPPPLQQIKQMQSLVSASEECEPGKGYQVDCNYCRCLENRNLLCTQKMCLSYDDMNRMKAKSMSGKPCTESSTYDCKQCDCIKGKMQCREIPDCRPERLLRGGEEPELELDETVGKCVPDSIYKTECNKCYCQEDGSLRCTQKTCLNFSQVKQLEEQREYLEKNGL